MAAPLISLRDVSLSYGGAPVLDGATLVVQPGARACVTGRNGEGKSTLLKILAGLLEPDSGEVIRRDGLKVSYLSQDVPPEPGLSGGQIRRKRMEDIFLREQPDLLLLDEPTNHLDLASIEWLEGWLRRRRDMACLFVTHDRAFLRASARQVYDLDRGRLAGWDCDYPTFLKRKAELLADEAVYWERKTKKLAEEEAWIRRGVKARTTRNEGRVAALMKLREEFAARRSAVGTTNLRIDTAAASGMRVLKIEDLSYAWGEKKIVDGFTVDVLRGERIGFIGPNGSGKTTLLNLLCGRLTPQGGSVTEGARVETAFFDQLREQLDPEATVVENLAPDRDEVTVGGVRKHVYSYLADFLFTSERARTPVKALSGGERARLLLARLFLKPANLLVMDEPTNDLDVETLELLEEQLLAYKGTLLLVSHDRDFLDHVVTSTFVLEGDGKVGVFPGGYSDWMRQRKVPAAAEKKVEEKTAARSVQEGPKTGKLSYGEKREFEALPARIEALEKEIAEANAALADGSLFASDPKKAAETAARLPEAERELEAAVERWAELGERCEI